MTRILLAVLASYTKNIQKIINMKSKIIPLLQILKNLINYIFKKLLIFHHQDIHERLDSILQEIENLDFEIKTLKEKYLVEKKEIKSDLTFFQKINKSK